MFEDLMTEIGKVKTRGIFQASGPISLDEKRLLIQGMPQLPESYIRFAELFGNASLYRQSGNYIVSVYVPPKLGASEKAGLLVHFGRTDTTLSYFMHNSLVAGEESPVFEWCANQRMQKTANGFEDWVVRKCKMARLRFKASQWKALV
jgi:hypothetical protein